jgi:hypothetical protein
MTAVGLSFRILKYALNIAGLYIMTIVALIVTTLVYRYPDCDVVRIEMSENIGETLLVYIPYLGLTIGINLLIERKIEKRSKSKEYLVLFYISLLVLTIAITYASYNFYSNCRK